RNDHRGQLRRRRTSSTFAHRNSKLVKPSRIQEEHKDVDFYSFALRSEGVGSQSTMPLTHQQFVRL
ncbi:hypothetical protein, partial [Alicyclobacillus cycloheptanicus]|uniref:hypothetical protein n=1 Tax=Alicyclobacillus cycloheptanicus TaxID=1457 RepID=UPI0027D7E813